jgi:2-dehydro-3-deoxyphosphogluconate aldolase / (4S)-4-hydroxy-2-oxoglutarate aldolase
LPQNSIAYIQATAQLKGAGLLALLQREFSLSEIIEIGDALLALPVLALEIDLESPYALEALAELRHRAGSQLLIGAGGIQSVEQMQLALAAGAQFTASPTFNPILVRYSQAQAQLHLPGVSSLAAAHQAAAVGCQLLKLFCTEQAGLALLQQCRAALQTVDFIASGEITLQNIATYAQAGAAAVAIGRPLIVEPYRSMASLISTARAFRAAWLEAQSP